MSSKRIWVSVSREVPYSAWWKQLCQKESWSEDLNVEKWTGPDLSWPRITDSLRSFTLFSRQKVLLVQDVDKALKKEKTNSKFWNELEKGPHHLVIQSENPAPKSWPFEKWKSPKSLDAEPDDRAIFRWIDAVQNQNLKMALSELEKALLAGQHPLVFLQLIARHYRLGRLIHHAAQKGLSEAEILKVLKIPGFAFQKWSRSRKLSTRQWQSIFDLLHLADWQLKSGYDQAWILRKLSFDLVEMTKKNQSFRAQLSIAKSGSLFSAKLMQFA